MKIRKGFVSNSSSSSFVVVFPQIPISDIDVMQMMFGNPPKIRGVQGWGDESSSIYDVAGRVFDDISAQKHNDKEKICGELMEFDPQYDGGNRHLFEGLTIPSCEDYEKEIVKKGLDWKNEDHAEQIRKIRNRFYDKHDKFFRKLTKMFLDYHRGEFIYVFEYGDHNGALEANCEQGDIFRYLPHVKINRH